MDFYYVRHGDPIYNPDSLTPLGTRQAEAVSKRLGQIAFDHVYASSSVRANLTATPTAEVLKKPIETLEWTNEHYAWQELTVFDEEGKRRWGFFYPPVKRQFNDPEVLALGDRWYDHPCFKNTTFKEGTLRVQRETDALLSSLGYEHDRARHLYVGTKENNNQKVVLFAHQGFGLAFLSAVLGIPYSTFATRFDIYCSTVAVIRFPETVGECIPRLITLGNDAHLFSERLPLSY